MARHLLSDAAIRGAQPKSRPFRKTDGGGLYVEVRPSGEKFWRYRYELDGRENLFTIGRYPDVGLKAARERHLRAREVVQAGQHPLAAARETKAARAAQDCQTFEAVAREWIEHNRPHWSQSYARQVETMLASDAFPAVGKLPLRKVSAPLLLAIIRKAEQRGATSIAVLLRQWMSAIFRYGVATARADSDPAHALKGAIRRAKPRSKEPLTREEIDDYLARLMSAKSYRTTVLALQLLLYLWCRPGELRRATWAEFDLDKGEWRVPAERMKMREPHIVPLSTQAIALLAELRTLTGAQQWLFPNYRRPRDCMTATTLNRALERMGYLGRLSAHGFRSTASSHLNEMGFAPDWIERQLAHRERSRSRAAYNKATYLRERAAMMQAWADWIDGRAPVANVVSIRSVA